MRVFYLGTSDDRGPAAPGTPFAPKIVEELLEAALGTDVEVRAREAWPNENLAGLLEQWMDEFDPDVVVLCANGFWFCYDSVPAKLGRVLGRSGAPVATAGLRLADVKWLAHNAIFRGTRRLATMAIGGDTAFTGDQVVERMEACILAVVRREGVVVAMRGVEGHSAYAETKRGKVRKERLRRAVNRALADVCARHHVFFKAREQPLWRSHRDELEFTGDGIHKAGRTVRMRAERIALIVEEAVAASDRPAARIRADDGGNR